MVGRRLGTVAGVNGESRCGWICQPSSGGSFSPTISLGLLGFRLAHTQTSKRLMQTLHRSRTQLSDGVRVGAFAGDVNVDALAVREDVRDRDSRHRRLLACR